MRHCSDIYVRDVFRFVSHYRKILEQDWPTPVTADAIDFAQSEGGEAELDLLTMALALHGRDFTYEQRFTPRMAYVAATKALDANLRNKPQYNRNNAKIIDAASEWADCAIMVATALGWSPFNEIEDDIAEGRLVRSSLELVVPDPDGIVLAIANAKYIQAHAPLGEWYSGRYLWQVWLYIALVAITDLIGSDLPGLVEARLARIQARIKAKKEQK